MAQFFFGLHPPENLKVVRTGAIAEDIGCGTDVFVHIKDCALILTKAYQRQYHRIWKGISHISDVSDALPKTNMSNIRHPPENMAMENHQVFNKEI